MIQVGSLWSHMPPKFGFGSCLFLVKICAGKHVWSKEQPQIARGTLAAQRLVSYPLPDLLHHDFLSSGPINFNWSFWGAVCLVHSLEDVREPHFWATEHRHLTRPSIGSVHIRIYGYCGIAVDPPVYRSWYHLDLAEVAGWNRFYMLTHARFHFEECMSIHHIGMQPARRV